jgi:hypothetical protein
MNKPKTKRIMHLVLFAIAFGVCIYVGALSGGSVADKIVGIGGIVAAAFMALKTALIPTLDKAIDELPEDSAPQTKPRDPQSGKGNALALAIVLAIVTAFAAVSWATVNLTTSIAIPNVAKWKVIRAVPNYSDDGSAYLVLSIQVQSSAGSGSIIYGPSSIGGNTGPWTLVVSDDPTTCQTLQVNPTPTGYADKLIVKTNSITDAMSAIIDAMDAAKGMSAKLRAAEVACLSTGVCGPGLAGT